MESRRKTRVVILGGGTAGWMTAATLVGLADAACEVTLIESEEIGIVGVGEATLPHIRAFIERLGIDERTFMAATEATFKLGIEFHNFGQIGDRYIHPFGSFGQPLNGVAFHHYWLRHRQQLPETPSIGAYSPAVVAAEQNRFAVPENRRATDTFGYAYQFDATRFGPFLRAWSEARGASRIEARVVTVERDPDNGKVSALVLSDGRRVEGDLFIDCSGFRSLLLGEALSETWEDWSHWLPCDRAIAAPCASTMGPIEPFTRAVAMPAGWRWRIPLRHRIGNGYVYSSAHCSDGEAESMLVSALEAPPLAQPRLLRFAAGRRRRSWVSNVIAIGLSSGFLEPLESTSIYLIQMAITQLLEHWPGPTIETIDRDGFNAAVDAEYDRIRDFLILHYHATKRTDSSFWNHVRTMRIPDTLAGKLELWRRTAHVQHYGFGLFLEPSWVAVYLGQGIIPDRWDQRADLASEESLGRALAQLRGAIASSVAAMPDHRTPLYQAA